jgi:hypothetical protein
MTIDEGFPKGWYCAALARDLSLGATDAQAFCGRPLRLRTCRNGSVIAELAGRPAPVRVYGQVVFVWNDRAGRAPSYELPPLREVGFTRATYDIVDVRATPALVMRDLADYDHFGVIHRYLKVSIDEGFSADGARCGLAFSFDWPLILGSRLVTTRAVVRSECVGLGYQLTTVIALGGAVVSRHRVMPTPTERGITRVTLGMDICVRSAPAWLPQIGALAHAFARRAFARDIATDADGWHALSVETRAEDVAARGPLATYWSWANQFQGAPGSALRRGGSTC